MQRQAQPSRHAAKNYPEVVVPDHNEVGAQVIVEIAGGDEVAGRPIRR